MMKQLFAAALGATVAFAGAAGAHGPSRQKAEMSVVLNATPAEVWELVGQFDDMNWHPAVSATRMEPEDAPADVPEESTRVLTLAAPGDPTITEVLLGRDDEKMTLRYMITDVDVAVLPVTNYSSTMQVKDNNGRAEFVWRGGFYRGFPNNDPPAELNDDAAVAAVSGIYQAGIDALAERFGRAE